MVGRALLEACGEATPLAVRRADGTVVPHPEPSLPLSSGDLLILLGEREALRQAEQTTGDRGDAGRSGQRV